MEFSDRLREEIEYNGFSIKEFAGLIGISNSTLLSYIDSRKVLPNVETACKMAKALNVSVEYLVYGQESSIIQNDFETFRTLIMDMKKINETSRQLLTNIIHSYAKEN